MLSLGEPMGEPIKARPPSVEAYLPISSLMSLTYLTKTGIANRVHPAGLLLGLFSAISPVAVQREESKCAACGRCAMVCPNQIPVDEKKVVRSVECTACFSCVEACGVQGAIGMYLPKGKTRITALAYGLITVAAFFFSAQMARAFNYWPSETSAQMHRSLYSNITEIRHP
jgi:ferredoxin